MDTFFASPERAEKEDLVAEIELVNKNPVITGLLHSVGGLLAILDKHRQIVALNDSFLNMLGIDDPYESLGLRPGEAVKCIHAHEAPAGCGTTKFCSTCGAAIAIVSSLKKGKPVERICALTVKRAEALIDIALLVRSHPIKIDRKSFLLLFLQDITREQQRAALERTFFHDINNMLSGLCGASEILALKDGDSDLIRMINQSSLRMKKEVEMQRILLQGELCSFKPVRHQIAIKQVIDELQSFFTNHPATLNKNLLFSIPEENMSVNTDSSLLLRVLCNMITNALESTDKNGVVKVWFERNGSLLSFCVWNNKAIRKDIALRIFQRNFSTKEEAGRGIGTYSMKLFGEKFLGGKVSFTTSRIKGTIFKFSLTS